MSLHLLSDPSPNPQNLWLLFAGAALTILYIAVIRPLRRSKDPMEKSPLRSSLAQQRSVERQMENLLVELSEMARQLSAQLDTRSAKLESLIREADEKIAQLQGQPPQAAPAEPQAPATELDTRHVEVYELADSGLGATQIAQKLARPAGEIELILALRPRRAG